MALYKGCFSIAAYTGIFHVVESILSELTLFEKYFIVQHYFQRYFLI